MENIITAFRKKYPESADTPDSDLLLGIHKGYYSDIPLQDFLEEHDPSRVLRTKIKDPKAWDYYKNAISQSRQGESQEQTDKRLYGERQVKPLNDAEAGAFNIGQGLTFNMMDELSALGATGLEKLTGGNRTYSDFKSNLNQDIRAYNKENPVKAIGGNLVGGIAQGVALAPVALGNMVAGGGKLATAGLNVADDVIAGGLSAYGDDSSIGQGAGESALFGGALRGVVKGLGAVGGAIKNKVANNVDKLKGDYVDAVAPDLMDKTPEAVRAYRNTVGNIFKEIEQQPELMSGDFLNQAQQRIQELKQGGFNSINLNDATEGAFKSKVAGITEDSLVGQKVKSINDARESEANNMLRGLQESYGSRGDKSEIGRLIAEKIKGGREETNNLISQKIQPLYYDSKYNSQDDATEHFVNDFVVGQRQMNRPPFDIVNIIEKRHTSEINPSKAFKVSDSRALSIPTTQKRLKDAKTLYPNLRMEVRPDYLKKNGDNWDTQDLNNLPINSMENIHHARRIVDGDISEAKRNGNKTLVSELMIERNRLDNILKENPDFAKADEIFAKKMQNYQEQDFDKFGKFADQSEKYTSSNIPREMFSDTTTPRQFKNLVTELERNVDGLQPIKGSEILSALIDDSIGKLDANTNIDSVYNALFSNENKKQKIAIMLGGQDSDKFKHFQTAINALKNLKDTKFMGRGSPTENKRLINENVKNVSELVDFASALKGGVNSTVNYTLKTIAKLLPDNSLANQRRSQEVLYNFFVNPKNTQTSLRFIADLKKAKSKDEAFNLLAKKYSNIPFPINRGATQALTNKTRDERRANEFEMEKLRRKNFIRARGI